MRSAPWKLGVGVAAGIVIAVACGQGDRSGVSTGQPAGDSHPADGGIADAGGGGNPSDAGPPDAGRDGGGAVGADGGVGPTDGGTATTPPLPTPSLQGWRFYTSEDGLASGGLRGVSADEGGNLWVAAGRSGVYVQRGGSGAFQKFALADGLHPYGYLPDGRPADTKPYLNAISVAGGPAGTAFIGYQGRETEADDLPPGAAGCESNWDKLSARDPAIYKSGDADKVTLSGNGIRVAHYDIFSGPGVVPVEPEGREKLCSIKRVVYDPANHSVWFGGNHGFAWGDANFEGNPTCNGLCGATREHAHPAINGYNPDNSCCRLLTDAYYGVAVDPTNHDVWFGGAIRSTRFRYGTTGDFFLAQPLSEEVASNKIDVWPDLVPDYPFFKDRVDDRVSAAAALPDGSVWMSSFDHGLAHIAAQGVVDARISDTGGGPQRLTDIHVTALAYDRTDGSLWIGYNTQGGGLSRLRGGQFVHYNWGVLGHALADSAVGDIQVQYLGGSSRRILVAFEQGVIGVYTGN